MAALPPSTINSEVMSGYIVNLSDDDALRRYVEFGVYGTLMRRPEYASWSVAAELTLADYLTMRPGDLIFFFRERTIYGVGRLISLTGQSATAALANFPGAAHPHAHPGDNREHLLYRQHREEDMRWVAFFRPEPAFFTHGLDMDEVLQADLHGVVRGLRVFEKRSFIQVEADEAQVMADLLLRRNADLIEPDSSRLHHSDGRIFPDQSAFYHARLAGRTDGLASHTIDIDGLLHAFVRDGIVAHEALLQAWLAHALTIRRPDTTAIFGVWDYVANQVYASPHKPVMYMDRIDLFGYTTRRLSNAFLPTVMRYKAIELKKDLISDVNVVNQMLKYVDWIAHQRAGGDYSLVDAYLVASGYTSEVIAYAQEAGVRDYIAPYRPYRKQQWSQLRLLRYTPTGNVPAVHFEPV
jgi:hypothetical protein